MSTNIIQESTRNIQPSFSSENTVIHSSNNTQQIRQKVSKNDIPHQKFQHLMERVIMKGLSHSTGQLGETNGQKRKSKIGTLNACEDRRVNLWQERDSFESPSRHMENRFNRKDPLHEKKVKSQKYWTQSKINSESP